MTLFKTFDDPTQSLESPFKLTLGSTIYELLLCLPHMENWKEACFGQKMFLGCQPDHPWDGYIFHRLFYNRTPQYHISPHWFPRHGADCNDGANAFWFPSKQALGAPAVCATSPACRRGGQSETKNIHMIKTIKKTGPSRFPAWQPVKIKERNN